MYATSGVKGPQTATRLRMYVITRLTASLYSRSTQNEHEHVRPKSHRFRAPRAKDRLLGGITTQGRRERLMWEIVEDHNQSHPPLTGKKKKKKTKNPLFNVPENERNAQTAPQIHHSMSQKVEPEQQFNMLALLRQHSGDPALVVSTFLAPSKSGRLNRSYVGICTEAQDPLTLALAWAPIRFG